MSDYEYEQEFLTLLKRVKADIGGMDNALLFKLTALASDHVHYAIEKRRDCAPVLFNALDLLSLVGDVEDYHQLTALFVSAIYTGMLLAVDNLSISVVILEDDPNPESAQ